MYARANSMPLLRVANDKVRLRVLPAFPVQEETNGVEYYPSANVP